MIEYIHGDLFNTDIQIIVHGCNCLGGFGAGIAYHVAKNYPEAKSEYVKLCKSLADKPEQLLGTFQTVQSNDKTIINAFTQLTYGGPGRKVSYDAMTTIFENLDQKYAGKEIALPKIGSDLGGGSWDIIEKIIDSSCKRVTPVVYYL